MTYSETLRKVWRYQNPYIEEQTTPWPKLKSTRGQTTIYKIKRSGYEVILACVMWRPIYLATLHNMDTTDYCLKILYKYSLPLRSIHGFIYLYIYIDRGRSHLYYWKLSFLADPRCQNVGVCQDKKPTKLYLWYHWFQAQWDKRVQHNH